MEFPAPDVAALLADVDTKGKNVTSNTSDEDARKALLESAKSLVAVLETPFEVIARMNWLEVRTSAEWIIGQ